MYLSCALLVVVIKLLLGSASKNKNEATYPTKPLRNLGLFSYRMIKVFQRMASARIVQVGSQVNGTHGSCLLSKQLHQNIWRAV